MLGLRRLAVSAPKSQVDNYYSSAIVKTMYRASRQLNPKILWTLLILTVLLFVLWVTQVGLASTWSWMVWASPLGVLVLLKIFVLIGAWRKERNPRWQLLESARRLRL